MDCDVPEDNPLYPLLMHLEGQNFTIATPPPQPDAWANAAKAMAAGTLVCPHPLQETVGRFMCLC